MYNECYTNPLDHPLHGHVIDAHFAGQVDVIVRGHLVSSRPQPVPVQNGTNVTTVAEGQKGWKEEENALARNGIEPGPSQGSICIAAHR